MQNGRQADDIEHLRAIDVAAATKDVDVGDRTFPVVDAGDGPVVLLLHGFPDSRRLWRYQVPALTDAGFRVVAPDLRGFGDAPKPEDEAAYALPTVIEEDVIGLMDAMNLQTPRVVGHDWGAHVAWLTAALHPDRVEQLAALTAGAPGNSGFDTVEQMRALWHLYFFQFDAAEEWLRHDDWQWFREWCVGGDDVDRYVEELSRPGALTAALNWYRANVGPYPPGHESGEYPAVTCPVMGVLAGNGAYLNAGQMKKSIEKMDLTEGSWRYEVIEESSHWMPTDTPVELNRLLVDFLEQ